MKTKTFLLLLVVLMALTGCLPSLRHNGKGVSIEITPTSFLPKKTASPAGAMAPTSSPEATATEVSPTATSPKPSPSPVPPTATPAPSPSPTASSSPVPSVMPTEVISTPVPVKSAIAFGETKIKIPTYPYAKFLEDAYNKALDFPYKKLNVDAYKSSHPEKNVQKKDYKLVSMENKYLRLSFLPEMGGRLYGVVFKSTKHQEFYQNIVIKPSPWGPPEQKGWINAGGMEWNFPVPEHGYVWGIPWGYITLPEKDVGSILLFTPDTKHLSARTTVSLGKGESRFSITHVIENPTDKEVKFQYWSNASLAPGPKNTASDFLEFIFPTTEVTVHSTGDKDLPKAKEPMPWPIYKGRNMSMLLNWHEWFSAFERPRSQRGYVGVYDHHWDEGMVAVFPPDVIKGAKLFGYGWMNPIPPSEYTDNKDQPVELHLGLTPTFWDWTSLKPHGKIEWSETWFPVNGIGGIKGASVDGAVNIKREGDNVKIGVFAARNLEGTLQLLAGGNKIGEQKVSLTAGAHGWYTFTAVLGKLSVKLISPDGHVILTGEE